MKAFARVWLLLGCVALACGGLSGIQGNSETHFLEYCAEDCGEGFSCICGVCTLTCDPASSCGKLDANAICRSADASTPLNCGDESQPSVCDVPCAQDSDCVSLGSGYQCQEGFCRLLESGCLHMGQFIPAGGSIPAPGSEACNTCSCTSDGQVICTRAACGTCEFNGQTYALGESFLSPDGCNMCSCEAENTVACDARQCTSSGGVGGTAGVGGTSTTTSTSTTGSTTTVGAAGAGGSTTDCYSPTQNLNTAYDGGTGCACSEEDHGRCVEGVALVCLEDGFWRAVEDGPCLPSTCNQPLEFDDPCDTLDVVGYWHNPATGQCEPYLGACPSSENAFRTLDACVSTCQDKVTLTAVVEWPSCEGLGEQISTLGSEASFARDENVITSQLTWGCGCPTRSVFVMAYEPTSPLSLRLCHDGSANECLASCSGPVSFDLSDAFAAANANDFVFVD